MVFIYSIVRFRPNGPVGFGQMGLSHENIRGEKKMVELIYYELYINGEW